MKNRAYQKQFDGWLLDVSTCHNGVILWVKTKKRQKVIQVFDKFSPEFFAVPKKNTGKRLKTLKSILASQPDIKSIRICQKYVDLEDHQKSDVCGVSVKNPTKFKKIIKKINALDLFTLYNTDLPIAQMYFYVNDLFPMAFGHFTVKVTRTKINNSTALQLISLELKDDNERLFYDLPPLKAIWLEIKVQDNDIKSYYNEPLSYAQVGIVDEENDLPRADGKRQKTILINEADEIENLKKIAQVVEMLDPDIILTQGGDEFIFPYLASRASTNRISNEIYLSRDKTPLRNCIFHLSGESDHYMSYGVIRRRSKTHVYFNGRFHLDTTSYGSLHFHDGNIPGVIEVARISRVSLQRLCRITIGGALQSIQFQNAYKLNHLIPPFKKSPEDFRSGTDLIRGDRGGHIFEPKIGVFNQVVELDFSSMYPSLMANYNISSETINCKCCKDDNTGIKVPGLDFHICSKREGIISKSIRLPLTKRLRCKKYVRTTGDPRYEFTDRALKWVLVVSFGYLGFRNARFGKIEAHQAVCAFAREFLMRSAEIAKAYGCKIIHGIVDSLWLQDIQGRSIEEFERVTRTIAKEITEETNIPMSWDGRYNVITFLPSQAHPDVPTLNHYWGIKPNGEKKIRGIEIRRRDTPSVIKEAQRTLLDIFMGVTSVQEFRERISRAKELFCTYVQKIRQGDVTAEELSISQRISRKPSQYKVNTYQAIAAKQAEDSGKVMTPGKKVNYIILNADADPDFPEKKVILTHQYDNTVHQYDKEKYVELLQRAFENVFPFEVPGLDDLVESYSQKENRQKTLTSYLE
ncbi:MAG: DNA polymerase domain-containing protein [Promethearchaeia archaeon]